MIDILNGVGGSPPHQLRDRPSAGYVCGLLQHPEPLRGPPTNSSIG